MILNIYKEKNWTSFDVVAKLRNILKIKKIGHAGTLDPLAEGVLIILTENDTKRQDEFMHLKKTYMAEISFGAESKTYDLEGELTINASIPTLTFIENELPIMIKKYIGTFMQKVPAYSAVKKSGSPLYKKARNNTIKEEDLPLKEIQIFQINVKNYYYSEFKQQSEFMKLPSVLMEIGCSSGTYIRSLAHDLGEDCGCGAVLTSLKRIKIGDFLIKDSTKIGDFKALQIPE